MPSSAIAEALGTECTVENVMYEMCKEEGFEKVATGVRKKLPYLASITNPLNGQSYELLVTVPGRPPLCLKCKHTGHFRRACQTPFCRHHNQYGHTTESCSYKKATYANVARSNLIISETEQTGTGGEIEEPTAEQRQGVASTPAVERPTPAARTAPPATRPKPAKRNGPVGNDVNEETRPTAPAHNESVYVMASVPSEMLDKAISEESMSDGDWAEVPELEEWTVYNRKRKGSHCSDSPCQGSDDSLQSKGGEGSHSTLKGRKPVVTLEGRIQKAKSPRKTQKKKH